MSNEAGSNRKRYRKFADSGDALRLGRLRFGDELRMLRVAAGLSQIELGKRCGCSGTRISRLETGEVTPDVALVMNIMDALEVPPQQANVFIKQARDANDRAWWKTSGMPERQAAFAELESDARRLRVFSLMFVPGLLQTADYMAVRFRDTEAVLPIDDGSAIVNRQERQKILSREGDPTTYAVVLDESVIRRRTAPVEVQAGQLRHLIEVAGLPNVDLRVLPFNADVKHAAPPLNSFYLFDIGNSPEVAVVETETKELHVTASEKITRYEVLFNRVHQASLSQQETIDLIRGVGT
ncbi:helix-turn-helix domain-containing protein [Fodinicola acaciae]|uniref:helix-turn-helix domain-containing protein n=1 Tax=Fodinicola acaciae TaxID=2681555 RepID=UPI0013D864C8|nr:helix-turn-helix transcriptional regulator [Fodinicola acaciae]